MLWVCNDCTTAYSPGAPACPHCGGTDYHEQGAEMPKNTRSAGATNAELDETEPEAEAEPVEAEVETEEVAPATRFPSKAAPKSEWVEAAESLGAPDDVLAASKTDIQDWVTANS